MYFSELYTGIIILIFAILTHVFILVFVAFISASQKNLKPAETVSAGSGAKEYFVIMCPLKILSKLFQKLQKSNER